MAGIVITHMTISATPAKLGSILSLASVVGSIVDSISISFLFILAVEDLVVVLLLVVWVLDAGVFVSFLMVVGSVDVGAGVTTSHRLWT